MLPRSSKVRPLLGYLALADRDRQIELAVAAAGHGMSFHQIVIRPRPAGSASVADRSAVQPFRWPSP
jgi:hypothetical protein